ncbi:MAG TPA: DeoR family transcriptional regulator [Planctomycetaceae bacterium]|nr:DeoR family transcriptional regulator [Planctomycetaceae bacterium]
MKTSIEPGDEQFLQQLHKLGTGSIQDLRQSLGVTATAIRQRLVRLEAQGFVEREVIRTGRGRPHHDYRVTALGLRELGDNYSELAILLWRELRSIPEVEVRQRVANRLKAALVQRYGGEIQGETLLARMQGLQAVLERRGFQMEVGSRDDLPILRENNCPYQELAGEDPGICELEKQVFEEVLGVELKLACCCRNGDNSCEFQPMESSVR